MQAQKEMNESTSNFIKENVPKNRHQRRFAAKKQRIRDRKAKKFLKAVGQLDSSY